MAEPAGHDLPYGQFGCADYDPEGHRWRFVRASKINIVPRPLGNARVLICAPAHTTTDTNAFLGIPSQRRDKQIRNLVKAHPDIQPTLSLLPPLLRASEAAEEVATHQSPFRRRLLDFGCIPSEASHKPIRVAALPSGIPGTGLRIVQVQSQRRGWDDTKSAWIEVPVVHGEETNWIGEGAPVQQICFGHSAERSDAFLAVRMLTHILIFRPILRRAPSSTASTSRLDANLVLDIPLAKSNGIEHVDVSFNPWFPRQFGVLDRTGRWAIWEIQGRFRMTAKCIHKGSSSDDSMAVEQTLGHDRARLLWVCNPGIIAICTRRQLLVANLVEGKAASTRVVHVAAGSGKGWILDMATFSSRPAHLCMLTSTHVVIYHVIDEGGSVTSVKEILSLRHYKNPEDATLSLSTTEAFGGYTIFVRSDADPVIGMWRLQFDEDHHVRFSDPGALSLPKGHIATEVAEWCFADVSFGNRPHTDGGNSQALYYRDQGLRLASLMFLLKDLTLVQSLYVAASDGQLAANVGSPTWDAPLGARNSTRLQKESFVVDDDDMEVTDVEASAPPSSLFAQRRNLQTTSRQGIQWTINFERTARGLSETGPNVLVRTMEVLEVVETIIQQQQQQQPAENTALMRTLREFGGGEELVDDIEEASERLDGLALLKADVSAQLGETEASVRATTRLTIRSIHSTQGRLNMLELYNRMLEDWITPLSPSVPGRVRLAKEQLVRRAAAGVALASRVIAVEDLPEQAEPDSRLSPTWELPMRSGMPASSQSLPSSVQDVSGGEIASSPGQSALPTPSATPSVTTGSSYPSSFGAPEVSHLSRYTTFSKPPPSVLPRSLNRVLAHWTVGTDPAAYDWLQVSRRISRREEEVVDEHMTERERRRMLRRAERHMRRQRREAAASQAAQHANIQALEIAVSASQPLPPPPRRSPRAESQSLGAVASSSPGPGPHMPPSASQVVPGRYGGRPPKKKKRKQGF